MGMVVKMCVNQGCARNLAIQAMLACYMHHVQLVQRASRSDYIVDIT